MNKAGVAHLISETDPIYTASIPNQLMYKADIPNTTDLNTYQTTGIYIQGNNSWAAAGTNYPVSLAGKLEVVKSRLFIWQTYHQYQGAGDKSIYKREYYNGTWSSWVKMLDANNATSALDSIYIKQGGNTFGRQCVSVRMIITL